jgi:hypothetical protein
MLSGWATMNAERQFEYRERLELFSKEELVAEVMFHFTRSADFERQKEFWRKLDQENGGRRRDESD